MTGCKGEDHVGIKPCAGPADRAARRRRLCHCQDDAKLARTFADTFPARNHPMGATLRARTGGLPHWTSVAP
ncbi:hypothetical protein O4H53_05415 [Sulfitobacter sp. G21635-S1]|uniref:hypothetical protein n=1 Tax=Sulfitobacter sp. G21635-S1 TaxID=3014043 RepID=UPI0022AECC7E|nr:hypothetical protein [Sulfitobacter sp. G21635-S1]MCZ4254967.1 hypothetical protein [Sulfitobacter sp. G21635-S1]